VRIEWDVANTARCAFKEIQQHGIHDSPQAILFKNSVVCFVFYVVLCFLYYVFVLCLWHYKIILCNMFCIYIVISCFC
jgi:putative flippase GtrA